MAVPFNGETRGVSVGLRRWGIKSARWIAEEMTLSRRYRLPWMLPVRRPKLS